MDDEFLSFAERDVWDALWEAAPLSSEPWAVVLVFQSDSGETRRLLAPSVFPSEDMARAYLEALASPAGPYAVMQWLNDGLVVLPGVAEHWYAMGAGVTRLAIAGKHTSAGK